MSNVKDRLRSKLRMRELRAADPKGMRDTVRKCHLKAKGWTPELYEAVYKEQHGRCDICGSKVKNTNKEVREKSGPGRDSGCADHVHAVPPIPRGVLCCPCNVVLAMASDSIVVLLSAVKYLEKHKCT